MAWQPYPMKVKCSKCNTKNIFSPKSDVMLGFPRCKKCQIEVVVIGEASVWDWIRYLKL